MPTSRSFLIYCQIAFFAASPNVVLAQAGTGAPPAATATETPAVVADGNSAETLLGKPVQSATGEDLGRIVDVIVDRSGMVRAVIIDFGGFLGVGSRKIAVDWHVLHFPQTGGMEKLIAALPRDQLRKAPVFKEGEPVVIMGRANAPPPSPAAPPASPAAPPPSPAGPPGSSSEAPTTPPPISSAPKP
jgi:hypothetical protein